MLLFGLVDETEGFLAVVYLRVLEEISKVEI
jgi:hypothetical protein